MQYMLGIDLGTSGVKTVIFTEEGTPVASATVEYPLLQPKNGWAEQSPEDWWAGTAEAVRRTLNKAALPAEQIAGIGLSGQMHGLVLLDKAGRPLRNAILWCDGRTSAECAEITGTVGRERLISITANPALTGFTAGKILWVRRHEPALFDAARHILLPKDYIRYRLTGEFACDVSDASGTNLLDVRERKWSASILRLLHLDPALLPPLYESAEVSGAVSARAAAETGLHAGTPVVGGAGDNAAAAVGMGVVESGKAFLSLGTSGVIFAHADRPAIDPEGRVHTFCHAVPGCYTVMSCTLSAGLSLRWLRDQLFTGERAEAEQTGRDVYACMTDRAQSRPVGANDLLFLPYFMGERSPILDERARGVFFGLSAMHTRDDLVRAVMEGVTYSQRACLDVFREMGVSPAELLACGGGAKSPFWRQMLADVLETPVSVIQSAEGPAFGAAILAGVGAGLYPNLQTACRALVRQRPDARPDPAAAQRYAPYYRLYASLYPALKDAFHTLAGIRA